MRRPYQPSPVVARDFISLQTGKPGLISAAEKDTKFRRSSSATSALQPTQFALQGSKKLKVRRLP